MVTGRNNAVPIKEIDVGFRYIVTDLMAGVFPGIVFGIASIIANERNPFIAFIRILCLVGYMLLYILGFTTINQVTGVAEDRVWKIHRPIVSGLIDLNGGTKRFYIYNAIYLIFSILLAIFGMVPVLVSTLAWMGAYLACSVGGLSRIWWCKNLMNGIGTFAMLGATWSIGGGQWPFPSEAWSYINGLGFAICWLAGLQDFRDVEADTAVGRKTYPMVFGDSRARFLMKITFALLPIYTHFFVFPLSSAWWVPYPWEYIPLGLSWLIVHRLSLYQTPEEDRETYNWLPRWYFSITVCAAIQFFLIYVFNT